MNVLIVYWHPEPRSFNGALFRRACETLAGQGHAIRTSDLLEMRFDPVSGRQNFTTVADPGYFKQQTEELHATEKEGFSAEVEFCSSSVSAFWNPTSCLDPRI
jgi:NAD(P)H dehydrogenase (quinone)